MPTVIDSLVVQLGLNSSKFKTGQKETETALRQTTSAAARAGKDMEASGAQAAEFFSQIKTEALGLIGVLAGGVGLKDLIVSATNSMAGLGREARNIGVSVPALSAFSNVIERNGGSAESARQSLFGLTQQIEAFKLTGDAHITPYLATIGAAVNSPILDIAEKFAAFVQKHKGDAQLVNYIGHGLGFDQGTINALEQIKSLAELKRELTSAATVTGDEAAAAAQLQYSWGALAQTAQRLRNEMASDLTPAMIDILKWTQAEVEANPKVVEGLGGILGALTAIGALRISASVMGLTGLASVLGGIASTVERVLPILGLLGLTGPAGGTDKKFSDAKNAEFLRDQANGTPMTPADAWWAAHMPAWLGGAPASPPIAPAAAHANMEAAQAYFLSQGYTPVQVAGILANMKDESGFNPAAVGDHGDAYGLFQWHPDRQREFRLWSGHDIRGSTVAEQLAFAQWELTHTEKPAGDALRRAKTAFAASVAVTADLRPAGGRATAITRAAQAAAYVPPPGVRQVFPGGSNAPTEVNINGPITIYSKATDAKGVAKDLANQLSQHLADQVNRGLN